MKQIKIAFRTCFEYYLCTAIVYVGYRGLHKVVIYYPFNILPPRTYEIKQPDHQIDDSSLYRFHSPCSSTIIRHV